MDGKLSFNDVLDMSKKIEADKLELQNQSTPVDCHPYPKRRPLRILLADDNIINQKVALLLLAELGYEADAVSNGLEALEALKRQSYDVVLMDVQMPEIDGLETSRRIYQTCPQKHRPKIIGLSAYAMSGYRERCLEAGMDDYLTKPIRLEELAELLAQCQPLELKASSQTDTPMSENNPITLAPETLPPALDPAALAQFQATVGATAPEMITELINIYLQDTPQRLARLQQALIEHKAAELEHVAHGLKSNSATFGALRLAALCKELERMGQTELLARAAGQLQEIEAEFQRVKIALETLRGLHEPEAHHINC